jgi:hypothetical protein
MRIIAAFETLDHYSSNALLQPYVAERAFDILTSAVISAHRPVDRRTRTASDSEGHEHPDADRETAISLTRIVTDDGAWGVCLGGSQEVADSVLKPAIVGDDPFYREKIWHRLNEWQRLHKGVLSDPIAVVCRHAQWRHSMTNRDCPEQMLDNVLGKGHYPSSVTQLAKAST